MQKNKSTFFSLLRFTVIALLFTVSIYGQNIFKNGDFSSGTANWEPEALSPTVAVFSVKNGEFFADVQTISANDWHIALWQRPINLKEGKTYTMSFDARATADKQVSAKAQMNQDPWLGSLEKAIMINKSMKNFSVTWKQGTATADYKVGLFLGKDTANVWIDNLILKEEPSISSTDVTALTDWISGTTNAKVSGNNRLLVVMAMGESNADLLATNITYGGQKMTKQTENMFFTGTGSRTYTAIYTLDEVGVNAATLGAIDVTWSEKPSAGSDVYSVFLSNVDQKKPVGIAVSTALTDTLVAVDPIMVPKGDMILFAGANGTNNTIKFKNDFIRMFETNSSWGDGVGGYKMGLGLNETPSFSQSGSGRMVICAIVAKKAGSSTVVKNENILPTSAELSQNYPNPFNPKTNINFSTKESGLVTLKVYNFLGQEVATLVNQNMQPGKYSVDFDASKLTSGVYLYTISAGTFTSSKKMILVK